MIVAGDRSALAPESSENPYVAGQAATKRAADGSPWFVLYTMALLASLTGATYEALVRQPGAYLPDSGMPSATLARALFALSAAAAIIVVTRRSPATDDLSLPCSMASLAVAASGFGFALLSVTRNGALAAALLVPATTGAALGALGATWIRSHGTTIRRLRVTERAVGPFRLLAWLTAFTLLEVLGSRAGLLRGAVVWGVALALLAASSGMLQRWLYPAQRSRPALRRLAPVAALGASVLALPTADFTAPLDVIRAIDGEVLLARRIERHWHVLAKNQGGRFFAVDSLLRMSELDGARYHEALVHPAMLATKAPRQVLVVGAGDGLAVKEVLRHAEVELVTLVVPQRELVELARSWPWLVQMNGGALSSPKVRVIEREPILWLAETSGEYDVIIGDLPDPYDFVEAKNYTRTFYERVTQRLAADGAAAFQATTAFERSSSFGSIVRTARTAQLVAHPYSAPVPSIGEWGFVLLSRTESLTMRALPLQLTWLNHRLLSRLTLLPPDGAPAPSAPTNTLHGAEVTELL